MELPENIYVLVIEHDTHDIQRAKPGHENMPPMVLQSYTDQGLKHAKGVKRRFETCGHGEIKIGRVVFDVE